MPISSHLEKKIVQPLIERLALTEAEITILKNSNFLLNGSNVSLLNNDSNYQTDAQLQAAIDNLIDSAPGTLDTLKKLATAINDNDSDIAGFTQTLTDQNNAIAALEELLNENPSYIIQTQSLYLTVDQTNGDDQTGSASNNSTGNSPFKTLAAAQQHLKSKYIFPSLQLIDIYLRGNYDFTGENLEINGDEFINGLGIVLFRQQSSFSVAISSSGNTIVFRNFHNGLQFMNCTFSSPVTIENCGDLNDSSYINFADVIINNCGNINLNQTNFRENVLIQGCLNVDLNSSNLKCTDNHSLLIDKCNEVSFAGDLRATNKLSRYQISNCNSLQFGDLSTAANTLLRGGLSSFTPTVFECINIPKVNFSVTNLTLAGELIEINLFRFINCYVVGSLVFNRPNNSITIEHNNGTDIVEYVNSISYLRFSSSDIDVPVFTAKFTSQYFLNLLQNSEQFSVGEFSYNLENVYATLNASPIYQREEGSKYLGIDYDNSVSGLVATSKQTAIDELAGILDSDEGTSLIVPTENVLIQIDQANGNDETGSDSQSFVSFNAAMQYVKNTYLFPFITDRQNPQINLTFEFIGDYNFQGNYLDINGDLINGNPLVQFRSDANNPGIIYSENSTGVYYGGNIPRPIIFRNFKSYLYLKCDFASPTKFENCNFIGNIGDLTFGIVHFFDCYEIRLNQSTRTINFTHSFLFSHCQNIYFDAVLDEDKVSGEIDNCKFVHLTATIDSINIEKVFTISNCQELILKKINFADNSLKSVVGSSTIVRETIFDIANVSNVELLNCSFYINAPTIEVKLASFKNCYIHGVLLIDRNNQSIATNHTTNSCLFEFIDSYIDFYFRAARDSLTPYFTADTIDQKLILLLGSSVYKTQTFGTSSSTYPDNFGLNYLVNIIYRPIVGETNYQISGNSQFFDIDFDNSDTTLLAENQAAAIKELAANSVYQGTAPFPGVPEVGDRWDEYNPSGVFIQSWYWHGVYWLSTATYTSEYSVENYTSSTTQTYTVPAYQDDTVNATNLFFTKSKLRVNIGGGNATNRWFLQLGWMETRPTGTTTGATFVDYTIQQTGGDWEYRQVNTNYFRNVTGNGSIRFTFRIQKVGSPQALNADYSVEYRLARK